MRTLIKAYTNDKWQNLSPSKRDLMNAKVKKANGDEEKLSPIRMSTKQDRYSGTPHKIRIQTSSLKVAAGFSPQKKS